MVVVGVVLGWSWRRAGVVGPQAVGWCGAASVGSAMRATVGGRRGTRGVVGACEGWGAHPRRAALGGGAGGGGGGGATGGEGDPAAVEKRRPQFLSGAAAAGKGAPAGGGGLRGGQEGG